mmetsp:Transcript_2809/g.11466  ORF Transcript_2809/g.11466 Transcript_2809/m.11466 type:complete len:333 (-) Transcript_2809:40-1038(-)
MESRAASMAQGDDRRVIHGLRHRPPPLRPGALVQAHRGAHRPTTRRAVPEAPRVHNLHIRHGTRDDVLLRQKRVRGGRGGGGEAEGGPVQGAVGAEDRVLRQESNREARGDPLRGTRNRSHPRRRQRIARSRVQGDRRVPRHPGGVVAHRAEAGARARLQRRVPRRRHRRLQSQKRATLRRRRRGAGGGVRGGVRDAGRRAHGPFLRRRSPRVREVRGGRGQGQGVGSERVKRQSRARGCQPRMRLRVVDHPLRFRRVAREDGRGARGVAHRRGGVHVRADLRDAGRGQHPRRRKRRERRAKTRDVARDRNTSGPVAGDADRARGRDDGRGG